MLELSRWIPFSLYAFAAVWYGFGLVSESEVHWALRIRRFDPVPGLVAVFGHLLQWALCAAYLGRLPFGTMWEALGLVTLVLAGSYLVIERLARSTALAGPFFGLCALASFFAAIHDEAPRWPSRLQSALFASHVTSGVIGLALLSAASLLAAAWLYQYRRLREREFTRISQRLPDLATLDRLFLASSSVGTVLLAIGGVLGVAWTNFYHLPLSGVLAKSSSVAATLIWNLGIQVLRQRNAFSSRGMAWMGFLGLIPVAIVIWAGARGI